MAINITIDNDSTTPGVQTLVNDQTAAVQTPLTADTGNDSDVTLSGTTLAGAGYSSAFMDFLNANSIFGWSSLALNSTQKAFAANVDGAVSSSSFVTVTASAGESVTNLFFSDSLGNALAGQQVFNTVNNQQVAVTTLDSSPIYLWSNGDYAIATTSNVPGAGRVVAAFYLNEAANHLSAQVQMVTFEALNNPVAGSTAAAYDDPINFSDVLQVSAAGSLSFNFDNLNSGSFLYAAVGSSSAGLLVTGQDLNVQAQGTSKAGDIITGGNGSDPSDTVNTSQGGQGATIGIDNQMFAASKTADGPVGVFTLVSGLSGLANSAQTTGTNMTGIDYTGYINAPSASIFISQTQGGPATFKLSLWQAGGAGATSPYPGHASVQPTNTLQPESSYNYLGDHTSDSNLRDDALVNIGTIQVTHNGTTYTWGPGNFAFGTQHGGITVSLDPNNANTVSFTNINSLDTISFTAATGTFNRFDVQGLAGSNGFDIGRIDLTQGVSVAHGIGSDLIVQDDGPNVAPTLNANATISIDESGPTAASTISFAGITKGDDPDVTGSGAIARGVSGGAVVDPHAAFGTDGPAALNSVTYALSLSSSSVSSGLMTTDGSAINLQNVGGVVVGVVQGTGAFAGQAAFAIAIDSGTGVVTLEQYLSLKHGSADTNGDSDEAVQMSLGSVGVTATATDGDGDTKTSNAVDISQLLSFHDDGPNVAPTLNANATISIDESGPTATSTISFAGITKGDDPDVTGSGAIARGVSGGAVVDPHAAFGADGPATSSSVTYALSLSALSVPSGLMTTDGSAINLQNVDGVVVGVVQGTGTFAGQAAFAIAINSGTGVVTLEQYLSLKHGSADTNGDSDEAVQLALGSVGVTVTATDGDADSKTSGAVDISQLLSFHDDGPSVAPTLNANATVSIDESGPTAPSTISFSGITKGDDPDVTGSGAIARGVSGGAVVDPHAAFGADGAATSGSLSYALSLSASSVPSGLMTTDGSAISLQNVGGVVVGVVQGAGTFAGQAAFAIAIDASSGVVTLEQYLSLKHGSADVGTDSNEAVQMLLGSVGVTVTATDGDGDSKTSGAVDISQLLSFHDDGPSISLSAVSPPSITDDESSLSVDHSANYAANFGPVYGADGPAPGAGNNVTYALSTPGGDSGLLESGTSNHVWLFGTAAGTIEGRAGATQAAAQSGTDVVFVVSIDGTGQVTLDQKKAVVHPDPTNTNESTTLISAGLVQVVATVHDGDGDSASTPLNIGQLLNFQDDSPTITAQIQGGTVAFATGATGTLTHSLNGAVGADVDNASVQSMTGVYQYTITPNSWTTPTNVYPNLNAVLSTDHTTLTYYSDAADTNAVYRLTLDQTGGLAGSYTFSVLQPPPNTQVSFPFTDLPSGQNLFGIIGDNKTNIVNGKLPDGGLLVLPTNPQIDASGAYTNASGTINTSQGGGSVTIGNTNQAFDNPGEGAYFMYVDNPATSAVGTLGLTPTSADNANTINFSGVIQATDASVSIVQSSGKGTAKSPGPAMHITAYEANPGTVSSNAADNPTTAPSTLVNNPTAAAANQGTAAQEVSITKILIHNSAGTVIETALNNNGTTSYTLGTGGPNEVHVLFTQDSAGIYSASISNLAPNETIEFVTATNHDLAKVTWEAGSFDIGGFTAMERANIPQQDFHFAVQVNDYDNDVYGGTGATFANFDVHVSGLIFS